MAQIYVFKAWLKEPYKEVEIREPAGEEEIVVKAEWGSKVMEIEWMSEAGGFRRIQHPVNLKPVEIVDSKLVIRPYLMEVDKLYSVPDEEGVYLRKRPDGIVEELEIVSHEEGQGR